MLTATLVNRNFVAGLSTIGAEDHLYFRRDGTPLTVCAVGDDFVPVVNAGIAADGKVYSARPTDAGLEAPIHITRRAFTLLLHPLLAIGAGGDYNGTLRWRRLDPRVRSVRLHGSSKPSSVEVGEQGSWESRLLWVPPGVGDAVELVRSKFVVGPAPTEPDPFESEYDYLNVPHQLRNGVVVTSEPVETVQRPFADLLPGHLEEEVLLRVRRTKSRLLLLEA